MLSRTRLLNLPSAMMKSGTYTHSKRLECIAIKHKRHFSLKSHSVVDNFHHVSISRHYSPVVLPKWSTLYSINVPSYRCISTTRMFFFTPNNNTDLSNGNNQLPNSNNSSKGQSKGLANHSQLTIPTQQPSNPFTKQQISWPWWFKVIGASIVTWVSLSLATWWEEGWKVATVDKAILKGTSPNPIPIHSTIDQQEVINEVISRFINKKDVDKGGMSFGVILSPAGTGKAHIVTQACCQHPKGVLYCKIMNICDIAKCLAEIAGMRIEPTFLGKLAGHFFGSPIGYYSLPDNDMLATTYVVKEIAKRSEKLKEKLGRPACLFIDGVDLMIARNDMDLFIQLVDLAKGLANRGSLRMIFVSSKGHIIPLLKKTSSQSRCDIMEIVITEDQAVDYLCGQGLPDELAERIVEVTGPQIMFCYHAIKEYHKDPEKKDIFNHIMKRLHAKFVSHAAHAFIMGKPATEHVIQALHKSEKAGACFDPRAFLEVCSDEEVQAKLEGAVSALVKANVLRYSEDSTLQWHNKLVRTEILKRLK